MANHHDIPNWAGKPPVGLHLDVLKGDKLIEKLMIDEKKYYTFGRNPELNDFCIDHASCSRVHAALVYHEHYNQAFLIDLGSTQGTYIESIQLEAKKPTPLQVDTKFHFGASDRLYILQERPTHHITQEDLDKEGEGGLLSLPETETELDNMTKFNTLHTSLGINDDEMKSPSHKPMEVDQWHHIDMDNELSMTTMDDSELLKEAFEKLLDEMLEKMTIDFCFENHRAIKESAERDFYFLEEHITKNEEFGSSSNRSSDETPLKRSNKKKVSKIICPCCRQLLEPDLFTGHLAVKIGNTKRRTAKNTAIPSDSKPVPLQSKPDGYSIVSFNSLPEAEKEAASKTTCLHPTARKSKDGSALLCKKGVKCHLHRSLREKYTSIPSTSS